MERSAGWPSSNFGPIARCCTLSFPIRYSMLQLTPAVLWHFGHASHEPVLRQYRFDFVKVCLSPCPAVTEEQPQKSYIPGEAERKRGRLITPAPGVQQEKETDHLAKNGDSDGWQLSRAGAGAQHLN